MVALGLQELGHDARVGDVVTQHPDGGPLIVANIRTGVNHGAPDVLVHRLWTEDTSDMLQAARDSGQTVLFDMDDDIWHWPAWNPAGQYEGKPGQLSRKVMEAHLQACDAVLTSSAVLAREIRRHTDRSVFECAAPIDARPYPWPKKWHDPMRLVWLGTRDYRGPDLETIVDELAEIVKEDDIEFHWLGAQAVDDAEWLRDRIGPRFHAHNWAPIGALPNALSYFDLGVIPSDLHPFNAARAANTGLALAAAGIPFCHSAGMVPAYEDAGLGAPFEPGHLAETLVALDADKDRISTEQRELVEREWNPKTCAEAWVLAATYGDLLHRPVLEDRPL